VSERARIAIDSRPVQVTLFEDRAEVVRRAVAKVPAGISLVSVRGVTAMVDDPSVIARLGPSRSRVLATRVVRQLKNEPEAAPSELEALESERERAKARVETARRGAERAEAEASRASGLISGWMDAIARVPRDGTDAWRGAYERYDAEQRAALDRKAEAQAEHDRARLDLERVELRLTSGRRLRPRFETAVEVQIEAPAEEPVDLELTYRTPCALWRPEHVARLNPRADGRGNDLSIKTFATVWQQTGEAWNDVRCRFSTARPARSASTPLLTDDVLIARRKTDLEKSTVVVEAREKSIALAGLGRGTRAVEEMPGVEDGGEPLTFEARGPVTIKSDGHPFRVEIDEVSMLCEVDRVAMPELSPVAHVRATATLAGKNPLLAGPVWVARNSELVGKNKTGFVARGEPFELGFGTDDGLRVRRRTEEKRETTPVVGTQKITRTVKLYVSNLSGSARRLVVTERFPVSEIGDVEIAVTSSVGARVDAKEGLARFDVELPARATRELVLAYRIEAASKVVLPF
jgi:uncharacterized protein (TIGR02231 family)